MGGRSTFRGWLARSARPAVVALGALAGTLSLATSVYLANSGPAQATTATVYREASTTLAVPFQGEWYNVDVHFLMQDDGDTDLDAKAAAARAEMVSRFPGAVEMTGGEMEAQYVQNLYWWSSRNVPWAYNSAGKPGALSGDDSAVSAGASAWSYAGVDFRFSSQGTTSAGTGACSGGGLDGTNTVGWAAQSGSVLAVTCTWYTTSGSPREAVEFDMQIDPDWGWTTGSPISIDLQSVMTHEFGHALGLGHSGIGDAVMFASYCAGCNKRALHADDIAGAQAIYGSTAAPTPTPTRTPTPTPTRTPTPIPSPTATPSPSKTATPNPTNTPTPPPATATATKTPTPPKTATKPPSPAATLTPPRSTGTPRPSLPLSPGANLVTWPNASVPPAQALAGVSNVQVVYGWNPVTRTWSRYLPGLPSYVSNMKTLERGHAYWILATGSSAIEFVP